MQVLVSGSLAIDRIMNFAGRFRDHVLPEKLHGLSVSFTVERLQEHDGGCAGNVAYALALLGVSPRILATAGKDFASFKASLEKRGIDTSSIQIDSTQGTASAYVMTDTENNQITGFHFGAGATPYTQDIDTEGAACAIIAAGNADDMRSFATLYKERGLPYAYDPAQQITNIADEDVRAGISGAAIVFGNEYELALMEKKTGWRVAQMLEHTPLIVVTLGEKGTRIISKEGEREIPAVSTSALLDPTGAGDAYRGGFLAGYIAQLTPEMCAKIGSAVAVHAIEAYGTQAYFFTKEELSKRYESAYGEAFPL